MSAFMVSDNHIAFLVLAVKRYTAPPGSGVTLFSHELAEMARVLKAECMRSVTHRYAHNPDMAKPCPGCGEIVCDPRIGWDPHREPVAPEYRGVPRPCPFAMVAIPHTPEVIGVEMTPVIAIKSALCYQYQSNEHDGWESSQAKRITDRLIDSAIAALDGYAAAPWGIE